MAAPLIALLFGTSAATFFATVILPIAWILLRALGIGAVTYLGLDLIQGQISAVITSSLTDISTQYAELYQAFGLMNIDILINATLSGFATKLTISALTGGTKVRQLKFLQG